MKEQTERTGFSYLRFFISFVLLVAAGLKFYQLISESIPPAVQGSIFTFLWEFFGDWRVIFFVVEFEVLFGFFLLSGVFRRGLWVLSFFCFAIFATISFLKWISGEGSCGCWGVISVNPFYTAIFDLIIVALIILCREQIDIRDFLRRATIELRLGFKLNLTDSDKRRLIAVVESWLLLSLIMVLLLFAMETQHDLLGERTTQPNGRERITLEPQNWLDKKLPLFGYFKEPIDESSFVENIHTVILVHSDCPKCRKIITELEHQTDNNNNIVIIELPSKFTTKSIKTRFQIFHLDKEKDWFAVTPCVIKLRNGICVWIKVYEK
ncbi:MAG: hypothetical protein LBQ66_15335 [Planctomycetaceae bacterium]|nr:hypothetical protein [Planctomycetaceae bacterium]